MRTTVTIENDLAVLLENRRREMGVTFKQALNDTLRDGLMSRVPKQAKGDRQPSKTETFRLGGVMDATPNLGVMLEILEGPAYK